MPLTTALIFPAHVCIAVFFLILGVQALGKDSGERLQKKPISRGDFLVLELQGHISGGRKIEIQVLELKSD